MTQSLELLLDADSDEAVRGQWQRLAAAGLPSLANHTGSSNRPHITIGVAQERIPDDIEGCFDSLAAHVPLELTLGAPILFGRGNSRILARLVVPNDALLRLQSAAAELMRTLPTVSHLTPGEWTPHVTLTRRLPLADLPGALDVLGDLREQPGQAISLRRWDSDARRTWLLG